MSAHTHRSSWMHAHAHGRLKPALQAPDKLLPPHCPPPPVVPGGHRQVQGPFRASSALLYSETWLSKFHPRVTPTTASARLSLGALSSCHLDPLSHLCE